MIFRRCEWPCRERGELDLVRQVRQLARIAREDGPSATLGEIAGISGTSAGAFVTPEQTGIIEMLDQPSVTDSKKSVQQVLDEAGVKVNAFTRFEVGQE